MAEGRYAEAEPLFRRALKIVVAKLGQNHSEAAWAMKNLGQVCFKLCRFQEAETLMRGSLKILEAAQDKDYLAIAGGINNIASWLSRPWADLRKRWPSCKSRSS